MRNLNKRPDLRLVADLRDGERYDIEVRVDLSEEDRPVGPGELINISQSGAAIRAHAPLEVGSRYSVSIPRIGQIDGSVVRKFDNDCYGVQFAIDKSAKKQLGKRLAKLAASDIERGNIRFRADGSIE